MKFKDYIVDLFEIVAIPFAVLTAVLCGLGLGFGFLLLWIIVAIRLATSINL